MAINIQEPVLNVIIKYRNHPSILIIEEVCLKNTQFSFRCVEKDGILKEILNLDASKAFRIQISHDELLRKMLIFSQIFFIPVLIIWLIGLNFFQFLNWQVSLLYLKRVTEILRKTIDQSAYFQTSLKYLSHACFIKFPVLWIAIYQSNKVGLEKVIAHSIACW